MADEVPSADAAYRSWLGDHQWAVERLCRDDADRKLCLALCEASWSAGGEWWATYVYDALHVPPAHWRPCRKPETEVAAGAIVVLFLAILAALAIVVHLP